MFSFLLTLNVVPVTDAEPIIFVDRYIEPPNTKSTAVSWNILRGDESVTTERTSPFLISASVLPADVTFTFVITFVPAAASPINSIAPIVPHPPSIARDELSVKTEPGIAGLPICTSPVTESTMNTSSSGSAQLEILNFCLC